MATVAELKKFHGLFAGSLASPDLLGVSLTVRDLTGDWKDKKFHGDALFDLFPNGEVEIAVGERGDRAVLPLRGGAGRMHEVDKRSQAWVSWREKWRKQPNDTFSLAHAQWTLFWGARGATCKAQLCRAEWDQLSVLDDEVSNAGQPHWHVDPHLPLSIGDEVEVTTVSALEELSRPQTLSRCLSFHRVHLAMGGWRNLGKAARTNEKNASCAAWQVRFSGDTADLWEWAIETVRYLKCQCEYIREANDGEYSLSPM